MLPTCLCCQGVTQRQQQMNIGLKFRTVIGLAKKSAEITVKDFQHCNRTHFSTSGGVNFHFGLLSCRDFRLTKPLCIIEPDYISLNQQRKGQKKKNHTGICARNTSCFRHQSLFLQGALHHSLTAVGPAGYNGGVHRLLNTAIPLNVVYKPTRLQKCIYSKYIMLFIVHVPVSKGEITMYAFQVCNCPCTSKALKSRTKRPGTDQICGPFRPDEVFGHKATKKTLIRLIHTGS